MSKMVASFSEYRGHIRGLLESLTIPDQLRFCLWCLQRFEHEVGEVVWNGSTESERHRVAEILSELKHLVVKEKLISASRALSLQREIESFGPTDDVAAIEVHHDAIEFSTMLWQTLELCRTHDVSESCAVSEGFMNALDYRVEGEYPGYCPENMFTFPELRSELALQVEWLRNPR